MNGSVMKRASTVQFCYLASAFGSTCLRYGVTPADSFIFNLLATQTCRPVHIVFCRLTANEIGLLMRQSAPVSRSLPVSVPQFDKGIVAMRRCGSECTWACSVACNSK